MTDLTDITRQLAAWNQARTNAGPRWDAIDRTPLFDFTGRSPSRTDPRPSWIIRKTPAGTPPVRFGRSFTTFEEARAYVVTTINIWVERQRYHGRCDQSDYILAGGK